MLAGGSPPSHIQRVAEGSIAPFRIPADCARCERCKKLVLLAEMAPVAEGSAAAPVCRPCSARFQPLPRSAVRDFIEANPVALVVFIVLAAVVCAASSVLGQTHAR